MGFINFFLLVCLFESYYSLHQCRGAPPSPRSDHAAAVHAERYLLIFGGGSHATCFNDLHVLDLHNVREPSYSSDICSL